MDAAPTDWLAEAAAAAELPLHEQDRIWCELSGDKPDLGRGLARAVRRLHAALPEGEPLRALSIGSSTEPQRRILHAFCEGGVHLLDVDEEALAAAGRRLARQGIHGFETHAADYRVALATGGAAAALRQRIGGRVHLVLLHHSLYYAPAAEWPALLRNLWAEVLTPTGAVHAVMMAARSEDPSTTTWLYGHFAGRWFGHRNDQCLRAFARTAAADAALAGARVSLATSRVELRAERWRDLMAVVWMVLLHPHVHRFPPEAVAEVAAHVRERFHAPGRPLVQEQDHLTLFRGAPLPHPEA
jgi:hypothetical protein